jgi:hypothetical protein
MFVGKQSLALGLLPFVAGDVAKLITAAFLLPLGWKLVGRDKIAS